MLTDAQIRRTPKPKQTRKLSDGKGLYLEVRPTGVKCWRYRYRLPDPADGGKLKEYVYTVGHFLSEGGPDHVGVEEARIARATARSLVKRSIHPLQQRKAEELGQRRQTADTFKAIAEEWIAENTKRRDKPWSDGHAYRVRQRLELDVYPDLAALPIRTITSPMVLGVMNKAKERGADVIAIKVRQIISGVFCHAISTLRAEVDPTTVLKGKIKYQPQQKRALKLEALPDLMTKIRSGGTRRTQIALELLVLTFVRPVELRTVERAHIDLAASQWRIPGSNMKMGGEDHIVPLSAQAVELFRELMTLSPGKYLFPNERDANKVMDATTMNKALKAAGVTDFTPHRCRHTASTHLNEAGWSVDAIERQLAHQERSASRRAYNKAVYMDERKRMMTTWSDIVYAWVGGDKVVPIRSAAA